MLIVEVVCSCTVHFFKWLEFSFFVIFYITYVNTMWHFSTQLGYGDADLSKPPYLL